VAGTASKLRIRTRHSSRLVCACNFATIVFVALDAELPKGNGSGRNWRKRRWIGGMLMTLKRGRIKIVKRDRTV